MSTQQQIDAWNAAVVQKQQEKAGQETILKVQQEQLAKAEDARINAELAAARAASRGASPEQVEALQRQARLADQAESDARIAAARTQDNIGNLDGSIRYNTSQRDQFQASLPALANPSSTVGDRPANAATNAAEIAPAPVPAPGAAAPVPPSQRGDNGGFVTNAQGELLPSDSAEAEEIRAEQNRVEELAAAPQREFVYDETTGEMVASDSAQAAELREEASREENRVRFENAPPGQEFVYDEATGEMIAGDSDRAAEIIAEERAEQIESERAEGQLEFVYDPVTGEMIPGDSDRAAEIRAEEAAAGNGLVVDGPAPVEDVKYDEFGNVVPNTPEAIAAAEAKAAEQRAAEEQAAAKLAAINQATLQSVYKAVGSSDWRVRLQLAPGSNYLYNAGINGKLDGSDAGILAPLNATNGVIFPYTPQINTSYKANYEQYDLVHSNYRGVYYKNSRVDDVSIRAVFTAQDTSEANYLLAVIHFFRSVTKMFYGKDAQRGTPPPLVFLSGLGPNQFNGHPCVISNFQYNLPDNVDYIRATSVNNYGTDLLNRRTPSKSSGVAGLGATGNRIVNAGLERFFPGAKPAPDSVVANVNNTQLANYVPTKLDIDITLIPVQTRSQVSKQFSLKGFANGELIKGGFW